MSNKEYYQKNKERIKARTKIYYHQNLERVKSQRKEYRQRNKEMIRERKKRDYEKNKDKGKEHRKEYRNKIMNEFISYKIGKCCSVCGYKEYPEILQFHHKDKNKSFNISTLRRTSNKELLRAEINKCVLLCPNCHSWLHYKEHQDKPLWEIEVPIINGNWQEAIEILWKKADETRKV